MFMFDGTQHVEPSTRGTLEPWNLGTWNQENP